MASLRQSTLSPIEKAPTPLAELVCLSLAQEERRLGDLYIAKQIPKSQSDLNLRDLMPETSQEPVIATE